MKKVTSYRVSGGTVESRTESLAPEQPLHITLNSEPYITTMRSPDHHDEELARGLLYTEGIITNPHATLTFATVSDPETSSTARIDIVTNPDFITIPVAGRRNQIASSSCGICGIRDPADLELSGEPIKIRSEESIDPNSIHDMFKNMQVVQKIFQETGGTHAAGAFTSNGEALVVREDIGRHNAVDKVIGNLLTNKKLNDSSVLTVSGRISYEIITKAYRAQIPILAAVSAPSSMAVETAQAFGITLIAFCRDDRLTVYSHPGRLGIKETLNA